MSDTKIKGGGRSTYKGIVAQSWAAISIFLQHVEYSDFKSIHFEAEKFADFNLEFLDGHKLICECKNRKNAFSFPNLSSLLKSLMRNKVINENDEILVICKKVNNKLKHLIQNYKYNPAGYYELLTKKHKFSKNILIHLPKVKFWVVDFDKVEGKNINIAQFAKILNFWIPKDDLKEKFDSLVYQNVYLKSQIGTKYTKEEFYVDIEKIRSRIVDNSGYFDTKRIELNKQLDGIDQAIKDAKSPVWSGSQLSALSTNPSLMMFALEKLRKATNLNLSDWKDLIRINFSHYRYSFPIWDILQNNISTKDNIDFVLTHIRDQILNTIHRDRYFLNDITNLIREILKKDKTYIKKALNIADLSIKADFDKHFYIKVNDDEIKRERVSLLYNDIYFLGDLAYKRKIVKRIYRHFDLIDDSLRLSRTHDAIFSILLDYVGTKNEEDKIKEITKVIIKQYSADYERFGIKFKGYEHMGSISSWSGNEYKVEDKKFITQLIEPILMDYYQRHPRKGWEFIQSFLIKPRTSSEHPDFLRRASIAFLIERYFKGNPTQSKEAFKILKNFINDNKGLPRKAELIFQFLYKGDYTPKKVWALVEISLKKYPLAETPFIEKIVSKYIESKDIDISAKAMLITIDWLKNPEFLSKSKRWFGETPILIKKLLKRHPKNGLQLFHALLENEWFNQIDRFQAHEYAEILSEYLKYDFESGIKVINDLLKSKPLSTNIQIVVMYGLYRKVEKDFPEKLIEKIFTNFVDPLLNELDNDIDEIIKLFPHANAREVFVDITEEIAKSKKIKDRIEKAVRIISIFISDPDPYLPGKDPEDLKAEYSDHQRILNGEGSHSIHSVRGKCAWVLMQCAVLDGRDHIKEIIELTNNLLKDKNLYVLHMLSHPLEQLARIRLTVLPEDENTLFLDDSIEKALKLSRKIELMAFKYLGRVMTLKPKAQIALAESVAYVFDNIRVLSPKKSKNLISNFMKFPNKAKLKFIPFFIFFALFRKDSERINNWKWILPGLYDDLNTDTYDEAYFQKQLSNLINLRSEKINSSLMHHFHRIIENKEKEYKDIKVYIESISKDFNPEVYLAIFRFVGQFLRGNFDECYLLFRDCLESTKNYMQKNKDATNEVNKLNYFCNAEDILQVIYKKGGKKKLLEILYLIVEIPFTTFFRPLKEVKDILIKMEKKKDTEKVFKQLSNKYPSEFYDAYKSWIKG